MGAPCYPIQMPCGPEAGRGHREDWWCVNELRLDSEGEHGYGREGEAADGSEEHTGVQTGSWYPAPYCTGLG